MKLTDIIALAKQGYKPNDIKELLALAEPNEKTGNDEPETPEKEEPIEDREQEKEEPAENKAENKEPDYKALYEKSQKALKEAQKKNRSDQTGHEERTPEQVALDHFNTILKGV